MPEPRCLDLFCGAGGAARGLQLAGFHITGVDLKPQPHYAGDEFTLADALEVSLEGYDCYWASPPCQGYSIMHNLPWLRGRQYPLLIAATLKRLEATGKPYICENVMGARHGAKGLAMRGAGWLCGAMFGLPFYRHRLMATNVPWLAPGHPKHRLNLHPRAERWVYGGTVKGLPDGSAGLDTKPTYNPVNTKWRQYHDGTLSHYQNGPQAVGVGWLLAAKAMGIDWMNRDELTQAIPPVYSEYMGRYMMTEVLRRAEA